MAFTISTKYGPLPIPEELSELASWDRDEMLAWLALNDPNGLWPEYIRNFEDAEYEHGELDDDDLRSAIWEQTEDFH